MKTQINQWMLVILGILVFTSACAQAPARSSREVEIEKQEEAVNMREALYQRRAHMGSRGVGM